ncbi:hypothetical protein BC832DRAFT_550856 [Gaertneriomyces semiglobifer]|nr:hypothetical protein BC832DRAFT_550856 [Gaertneriomyces semiglobifer]
MGAVIVKPLTLYILLLHIIIPFTHAAAVQVNFMRVTVIGSDINFWPVQSAGDAVFPNLIAGSPEVNDGFRGQIQDFGHACDLALLERQILNITIPTIALVNDGPQDPNGSEPCDSISKIRVITTRNSLVKAVVLAPPKQSGSPAFKDLAVPVIDWTRPAAETVRKLMAESAPPMALIAAISKHSVRPNFWQYILIVVIILLGVSLLTSVLFHVWLFRKRRNASPLEFTPNEALEMGPQTLEKHVVESFPATVYSHVDALKKKKERKSAHKNGGLEAEIADDDVRPAVVAAAAGPASSTALAAEPSAHFSPSELELEAKASPVPLPGRTLTRQPTHTSVRTTSSALTDRTNLSTRTVNVPGAPTSETCAICLGDFMDGEIIRTLPCAHYFHSECIDPWLMEQSTCCPLCKEDCTPEWVKVEREKRGVGWGFGSVVLTVEEDEQLQTQTQVQTQSGVGQERSSEGQENVDSHRQAVQPHPRSPTDSSPRPPWHIPALRIQTDHNLNLFVAPALANRLSRISGSGVTLSSPNTPTPVTPSIATTGYQSPSDSVDEVSVTHMDANDNRPSAPSPAP